MQSTEHRPEIPCFVSQTAIGKNGSTFSYLTNRVRYFDVDSATHLVVMPNVYTTQALAEMTNVQSMDYTLASPSGLYLSQLASVDWMSNPLVRWQLDFFRAAVDCHSGVKTLRLSFVRERLPQPVWSDLVKWIVPLKKLNVLCLSHMRSPSEQPLRGSAPENQYVDEFLRVSHSPRPYSSPNYCVLRSI